MKLINRKFTSQNFLKSGTAWNKPQQARTGSNEPETAPIKRSKAKPPSLWVMDNIDKQSMLLNSI